MWEIINSEQKQIFSTSVCVGTPPGLGPTTLRLFSLSMLVQSFTHLRAPKMCTEHYLSAHTFLICKLTPTFI